MISLKSKSWQIDNVETVLFDKDGTFIDLHFFWGNVWRFVKKQYLCTRKTEMTPVAL